MLEIYQQVYLLRRKLWSTFLSQEQLDQQALESEIEARMFAEKVSQKDGEPETDDGSYKTKLFLKVTLVSCIYIFKNNNGCISVYKSNYS